MSSPQKFSVDWEAILRLALASHLDTNRRTGEGIYAIRGGVTLQVDLSDGLLPVPRLRRIHLKSAAAEVAWFMMGTRDVTWMRQHAPFWDKFTEDDGVTIANAYGHRWMAHFGRDQIRDGILALTKDYTDRRVYIGTWDPAADGLGRPGKNVPCPVGFTLSVLDGELHSSMLIRSSDLFVGLPYDVLGHALLVSAIAETLGIRPGVLTFTMAHPHLYAKHVEMVTEGLGRIGRGDWFQPLLRLDDAELIDIIDSPDDYVATAARVGQGNTVAYNPRPEVIP